jgi:hypothetical protein
MWFSTLFLAVAIASFATAVPRHQTRGAFSAKGLIEKQWKITNMKLLATLNFKPYELTNVRLECDADPDMFTPSNYTCGFTCKPDTWREEEIWTDRIEQSIGLTPTLSSTTMFRQQHASPLGTGGSTRRLAETTLPWTCRIRRAGKTSGPTSP